MGESESRYAFLVDTYRTERLGPQPPTERPGR